MAGSASSAFATAAASAGPSRELVRAWPSLSQAAQMLGISLSALSRAMDAKQIPKHRLGGRARKIAPVALLDLAVEYGADVPKVADEAMAITERSGVAASLIASIEQGMGAWFAERAVHAPGPPGDRLAALIDAMREVIGADAAQDILARAGITPAGAIASERRPSAR